MTCVICKNKKVKRGTTVLPIERGETILLITDIPAGICANCGEPTSTKELPGKSKHWQTRN